MTSRYEGAAEKGRALRQAGAAVAREVADVMDQRAATLRAIGASDERIRAVQAFADAERRIAADWDAAEDPIAE